MYNHEYIHSKHRLYIYIQILYNRFDKKSDEFNIYNRQHADETFYFFNKFLVNVIIFRL